MMTGQIFTRSESPIQSLTINQSMKPLVERGKHDPRQVWLLLNVS